MLEVKKIKAYYGGMQVLWDVSLFVKKGELVTIIGPNGAGKTTTLRTIMGLVKNRSGEILFEGVKIHNTPTQKIVEMGITMVPEGRELFPQMSVRENLELGAFTSRARKYLDDSLIWVYNIFPILKKREKQLAGTLSGGEQQMLAIARALMSRPKLLLIDEPSLGLAPLIAERTFEVIRTLHIEHEMTILLVEQKVIKGLELSDRAYVLENGRIVAEGDAKEIRENKLIKTAYLGI
jgi:branched-chain amino acid transport system ATP-binding protein